MNDVPFDPLSADPRELMQAILPRARNEYIKAWELLADPATQRERRRLARERVQVMVEDRAAAVELLRAREATWSGEDLRNARHLAGELERHIEALGKLGAISARGLLESQELRPDALGCGRRFRTPDARIDPTLGSRGVPNTPAAKQRDPREQRKADRPFADRGPKAPRDQLGSSKHDSQLGDSLDEATRARLEQLRADES